MTVCRVNCRRNFRYRTVLVGTTGGRPGPTFVTNTVVEPLKSPTSPFSLLDGSGPVLLLRNQRYREVLSVHYGVPSNSRSVEGLDSVGGLGRSWGKSHGDAFKKK